MSKPEGPTPPSGYRWVPKGDIVWPTDVFEGVSSPVPVSRMCEWGAAGADHYFLRQNGSSPRHSNRPRCIQWAPLNVSGSRGRLPRLCGLTRMHFGRWCLSPNSGDRIRKAVRRERLPTTSFLLPWGIYTPWRRNENERR